MFFASRGFDPQGRVHCFLPFFDSSLILVSRLGSLSAPPSIQRVECYWTKDKPRVLSVTHLPPPYQLYLPTLPMPSHLKQFLIDIDKELETWEEDHDTEYIVAKVEGVGRLETCIAEGQISALERQRTNFMMKQLPDVRSS